MTNNTFHTAFMAILVIGLIGAGAASAAQGNDGQDDAVEFAKLGGAKVSLSEAIAAAEQKFGGKAVNAALDNEQTTPTFEIELMSASGSQTVSVDGQTGMAKVTDDNGQDGNDTE